MRLILITLSVILLSGCEGMIDEPRVWHDDKRFVTCYMSPAMESIYCIPDSQLEFR